MDGYNVVGNVDDLKKFSDYLGAVLTFAEGEIKSRQNKGRFFNE
jgi:hypothetical protein